MEFFKLKLLEMAHKNKYLHIVVNLLLSDSRLRPSHCPAWVIARLIARVIAQVIARVIAPDSSISHSNYPVH